MVNRKRPNLDRIFGALSDPTRRAILSRLMLGEAPVKELTWRFDISAPAITKHLKVLEGAGLISRDRDGTTRPCRLRTEPLEAVDAWVGQYRQFWEESFDRLERHLETVIAKRRKDGR